VDYFTFCYLPIYQSFVFQIACTSFAEIRDACVLNCCFFHFFREGTVYTHV
jgi:hypothetical protein